MDPNQIVLGRVGHYFDAGNGSCSTALVVGTFPEATGEGDLVTGVNVQAWHHGGEPFTRTSVPVVVVIAAQDYHENSFHLTRDCPWGR